MNVIEIIHSGNFNVPNDIHSAFIYTYRGPVKKLHRYGDMFTLLHDGVWIKLSTKTTPLYSNRPCKMGDLDPTDLHVGGEPYFRYKRLTFGTVNGIHVLPWSGIVVDPSHIVVRRLTNKKILIERWYKTHVWYASQVYDESFDQYYEGLKLRFAFHPQPERQLGVDFIPLKKPLQEKLLHAYHLAMLREDT